MARIAITAARPAITTERPCVQNDLYSIQLDGTATGRVDSATGTLDTTVYTMIGWAFPTFTTNAFQGISVLHNGANPRSTLVSRFSNGNRWGYFDNTNGTIDFMIPSPRNVWQCYALVIDGTSMKFYLNGVERFSTTITTINGTYTTFSLGSDSFSGNENQAGNYGRSVLANFAMTLADVNNFMKCAVVTDNGAATTPWIDWRMTDGSGTITDVGSKGLDGTIGAGGGWSLDTLFKSRPAITVARTAIS